MQLVYSLAAICGQVFPAWPVLVLIAIPLSWRRREDMPGWLFGAWAVLLVIWSIARIAPARSSYLIPEPVNTYLFFLVGALLFILFRESGRR